MNTALSLARNELPGIALDDRSTLRVDDRRSLVELRERLVGLMLGGDVSPATLATLAKADAAPQMAALILGSPEFQKR